MARRAYPGAGAAQSSMTRRLRAFRSPGQQPGILPGVQLGELDGRRAERLQQVLAVADQDGRAPGRTHLRAGCGPAPCSGARLAGGARRVGARAPGRPSSGRCSRLGSPAATRSRLAVRRATATCPGRKVEQTWWTAATSPSSVRRPATGTVAGQRRPGERAPMPTRTASAEQAAGRPAPGQPDEGRHGRGRHDQQARQHVDDEAAIGPGVIGGDAGSPQGEDDRAQAPRRRARTRPGPASPGRACGRRRRPPAPRRPRASRAAAGPIHHSTQVTVCSA